MTEPPRPPDALWILSHVTKLPSQYNKLTVIKKVKLKLFSTTILTPFFPTLFQPSGQDFLENFDALCIFSILYNFCFYSLEAFRTFS